MSQREMIITPAYDKRNKNQNKNFGIVACRIFFIVKGKEGVVAVNFGTNWYLPSTIQEYKEERIHKNKLSGGGDSFKTKIDLIKSSENISAWSIDYHSKKPMFKGYTKHKYCEFIGWDCYCDGSCLAAKEYLQILFEKGSDEVFKKLEEDYETEFGRKTKSKRKKMLKNNIVWVGLMRLITFNYKKFCKPTSEGWRRN